MAECRVLGPGDHAVLRRGNGTFGESRYFPPIDLDVIARVLLGRQDRPMMHPFMIEITDHDGDLHAAAGAAIAFITAGSGYLKTQNGKLPFTVGSVLLIPPRVPHISVADPGTKATEYGVYVGDPADLQRVIGR